MPMDNALNVSELLKRIGVVGDSKASVPLLEDMRLVVKVADLSGLVPPVPVAIAGSTSTDTSGPGTRNQSTLHCLSPGGLTVLHMLTNGSTQFRSWISDTDPFVGTVARATAQLGFGATAVSRFRSVAVPGVSVAPGASYMWRGGLSNTNVPEGNWVGPGQFWNIESDQVNVTQLMNVLWREYPGAIIP